MTGTFTTKRIEAAILSLLEERGTATACPSDVARKLSPEGWRSLMQPVRAVASRLVKKNKIDVYQHGRPVDLQSARGPIRLRLRAVTSIDYRKEPHRYRIGRGEQGVLTVEPYKSELLPLWRFSTPDVAEKSAKALTQKFREYAKAKDFVGMDMTRKFLQMGWTRSRRYANHKSGRKYKSGTRAVLAMQPDERKAQSAAIFRRYYERVMANVTYRRARKKHEASQRPTAKR